MSTFDFDPVQVTREASRFWWLFLLTGLAWLLFSIIVFRFDYTTVTAVSILFGIVALFAGVNEFLAVGVATRWWKVLHGLLGVDLRRRRDRRVRPPGDTFAALAA